MGSVRRRVVLWRNLDHVEIATLEWVDWYNHRRPHEAIDDFTQLRPSEWCTDPGERVAA